MRTARRAIDGLSSPCDVRFCKRLSRFRELLRDAEELLAPAHLRPDIGRIDAEGVPQDDEMIEEIGALVDDARATLAHRVEGDLGRFLDELLAHLGEAGGEELLCPCVGDL